jgi:anaerobic selenocysteine-containing dehydrogenase
MNDAARTVYRACNLCEAICGLEIRVDGSRIVSIRGDAADPFSRGHICPKGVALIDIHEDPNRLRRPMQRTGGQWRELAWDEAFDLAAERLSTIVDQHGNDAIGFYIGNPTVHNSGTLYSIPQLVRVVKTRNVFSASSVDQLPNQLASLMMYGHQFLLPIPDIDRTAYFLILGANPVASNGSLMTAKLDDAPHGLDLGPLIPSLYDRLETPDAKIHCAPPALIADVARFRNSARPATFTLIGRRHLRSNNSWMHHSHRLIKGPRRDQLMMHPDDVASLRLADGQLVEVRASVGSVRIPVQSTDEVMRGVVCLPHGFGHHRPGTRLGLAEQHPGVSYNDLTDDDAVDAISGNAALNGTAVEIVGI